MAADTGNGATLTLSGYTALIVSINIGEQTIDMLDISTLATTGYMEKIAADLADAGSFTVNVLFDPTDTDAVPTLGGAAASTTITWPSQGGTAATLIGTACKTGLKLPDLANNTVQEGSLTITWDGVTGPAFTPEA